VAKYVVPLFHQKQHLTLFLLVPRVVVLGGWFVIGGCFVIGGRFFVFLSNFLSLPSKV